MLLFAPATNAWKQNLIHDEYCGDLLARRVQQDFELLPKAIRKTMNSQDVEMLVGRCAAMSYAQKIVFGHGELGDI